jgi:DNA mismatch repair protein MutS2
MRFVDERPSWGMGPIPDVGEALGRLSVQGAVLDPTEIHHLGVLLGSSRGLSDELGGREGRYPELETIGELLLDERSLEESIRRCVDADGQVLDSASKELKRIRDRLRGAHSKIVRKLETYVGTLPDRFLVPDASITIREGRYVIPLRREGKREVGGIVHDESQTGATVFVEPPAAIELMNQVRDLEGEQAREVRRILGELTARIEPKREALVGALAALADFDGLNARARAALEWRAVVPELTDPAEDELQIREGRHPLLVETMEEDVVPFDLDLGPEDRAIVVSGPNTGGKSVFLKATGLIAALTQSGVVPPVGKGTRLPVFRSFFADIGDEQSIAQNLSTFSAHLGNLSEIVGGADRHSLVLIDEMGTGTDPAEGAALSRAVLEALVDRGARTIVSSHLGELKRLDVAGSGIVNASLEFDADRMEPTYRVVKGRPGRSYGLAIARRLGFPGNVLDRAEAYRDDDEARMEEVLARLERREREAEQLVHELDLERVQTSRLRAELEAREEALRDAESTAGDRARESARKLLLEARAEVEEAVREVRRAADEGEGLDEAVRSARRRVEAAAARQQRVQGATSPRSSRSEPRLGDRVRIGATGAKGHVVELRADRAQVEVGGIKLEVPLEEVEILDPLPDKRGPSASPGPGWSGPPRGEAKLEIDLRGLRVHELEVELMRALDQAILEGLSELRIIHGKGTGALRKRVGEMLESDRRVGSVRMGGPTEGGAGVTVATFGAAS